MAIYTKRGKQYDTTGKVLYGPVPTNTIFKALAARGEANNNGDAVVRYDQLADRWLVVMPIFRRSPRKAGPAGTRPRRGACSGERSRSGRPARPGSTALCASPRPSRSARTTAPRGQGGQPGQPGRPGPYSMCYAVSVGPDPLAPTYRYEFLRPLFPDYPRPAIWPDGYYIPPVPGTSDPKNMHVSWSAPRC